MKTTHHDRRRRPDQSGDDVLVAVEDSADLPASDFRLSVQGAACPITAAATVAVYYFGVVGNGGTQLCLIPISALCTLWSLLIAWAVVNRCHTSALKRWRYVV